MPNEATQPQQSAEGQEATALLVADHQAVSQLFQQFETAGSGKGEIARQICQELTVHATIEEEIFYPAVREVEALQELVDESIEEHAEIKALVGEIQSMGADDQQLQTTVTDLKAEVEHHVAEEQDEMFPQVREAMDALKRGELGSRMAARKQELKSSMAAPGQAEQRTTETVRGEVESLRQ